MGALPSVKRNCWISVKCIVPLLAFAMAHSSDCLKVMSKYTGPIAKNLVPERLHSFGI